MFDGELLVERIEKRKLCSQKLKWKQDVQNRRGSRKVRVRLMDEMKNRDVGGEGTMEVDVNELIRERGRGLSEERTR